MRATVAGGSGNNSSANYATVGGGYSNTNNGRYAAVGGGLQNFASGQYVIQFTKVKDNALVSGIEIQ